MCANKTKLQSPLSGRVNMEQRKAMVMICGSLQF